jgi:hypothetical protein
LSSVHFPNVGRQHEPGSVDVRKEPVHDQNIWIGCDRTAFGDAGHEAGLLAICLVGLDGPDIDQTNGTSAARRKTEPRATRPLLKDFTLAKRRPQTAAVRSSDGMPTTIT